MSRDDEKPELNPEDDDHQGDRPDSKPDKPTGDSSSPTDGDDGYERGAGSARGDGGFPKRYQPTSHPEDAPGGFNPNYRAPGGNTGGGFGGGYGPGTNGPAGPTGSAYSGYQPYPGAGDTAGYHSSGQSYSGYAPGSNGFNGGGGPGPGGVALEKSDGNVDIMRAVRFGFKSVFANPAVWILGTVLVGVAFMFLSITMSFIMMAIDPDAMMSGDLLAPVNIIMNLVIGVFTWAVMICVMRGALLETDGHKVRMGDFFHPINVGQTLFLLVIMGVVGLVFAGFLQFDTANLAQVNETTAEVTIDDAALGRFFIYMAISAVVAPLHTYWVYYAADGRENAMGAIRHGFLDSARNYFKLLAYSILAFFVVMLGSILTLALGLVVLLPAGMLISTHIYRQISGGNIPVEHRN